MSDLFGTITFEASHEETANNILERAGVVTTYQEKTGVAFWTYKGKTVLRPRVNNWEEKLLEHFNILIKYV